MTLTEEFAPFMKTLGAYLKISEESGPDSSDTKKARQKMMDAGQKLLEEDSKDESSSNNCPVIDYFADL